MKGNGITRKARYGILAAIVAGAFSIMPAAQAMPTGGVSGTATITQNGTTMDIASTVTNNLLTWQDFSVAKGETVNFGGTNTYLNVVTGANKSLINGAITGSQANVYLVNPNGILIGDTGSINVASMHLSTADISGKLENFTTAMDALSAVTEFKGDIVNKGTLTVAKEITVSGENITFKNTADVTAGSVTLTATNGEIHIGSSDGAKPDYNMNGNSYMYKLVSTAEELQNINNDLSGNYMLAGNITLTAPEDTETGSNFTPLAGSWSSNKDDPKYFTGRFDGLNYTIDNLYLYANTNTKDLCVGLFRTIGKVGVVENLVLGTGKSTLINTNSTAKYRGYNGSVVGLNLGTIRNVTNKGVAVSGQTRQSGGIVANNGGNIDGAVNCAAVTSTFTDFGMGGIAGEVWNGGTIKNSRNTGVVTSSNTCIGGIVGIRSDTTVLSNVSNEGAVSGGNYVGGIMGDSNNSRGTGSIDLASNSGTVSGNEYVGGIAGHNTSNISNAANSGTVQGTKWIGGVIGHNDKGTLINAYNTGSITNVNDFGAGGVVGANEGIVENVYNTGVVTGVNIIGGIAALNGSNTSGYGVVKNAYNTGKVTQATSSNGYNIGGIVGYLVTVDGFSPGKVSQNTGRIENAYNTGEIIGCNNEKGGIFGHQTGDGTVLNAYDASSLSAKGLVGGTSSSVSGAVDKSLDELKQAGTFAFTIDSDGTNSEAAWRIYEEKTTPLLTAFLTPLTLADTTATYDGQAHNIATLGKAAGGIFTLTTLDETKISGGSIASYTDARDYKYTGLTGLYSNQQGYNIKAASDSATLTVSPRSLDLVASGYSKTYDGTTTATGGTVLASKGSILGGVGVLSVAYSDKNAGTDKAMAVSNLGNNYQVTTTSKDNTITAAPLTLTVADTTKVYDGTTSVTDGKYTISAGQLFGTDALSGGVYAYDTPDVGTGKTVSLTGITAGDNYELTVVNSTNSSITAKAPDPVNPEPVKPEPVVTEPIAVIAEVLEDAGTTMAEMEAVTSVATAPPPVAVAAVDPAPATEPDQTENNKESDGVETAATTATTHGDNQGEAAAPAGEKQAVHNALGGDGLLTIENEGVNPPEAMSADSVAEQQNNKKK